MTVLCEDRSRSLVKAAHNSVTGLSSSSDANAEKHDTKTRNVDERASAIHGLFTRFLASVQYKHTASLTSLMHSYRSTFRVDSNLADRENI